MLGFKSDSGPDGTAHHGAQQGKVVTSSEQSQPQHLPWCWPEPIRSESSLGTLTTLNAKPQSPFRSIPSRLTRRLGYQPN
ncbi:hypothetical protein AVEN_144824-1 [Araneus ventricosus]|uniref:Uncharacterized protein n=1 Tax=Araneus ventricosus TaxID=182803 RepID=A0A4Y2T426_ARAVE|nr:hypothetical protein AVEN_144824-1 [Araneus ventricosus]